MTLIYKEIAEEYKPIKVKTLLIGEAPPPNGTSYFYVPKVPVREISMPSTVFHHYFGKKPVTVVEYIYFLKLLKKHKIFLIDICDIPLRITNKAHKGWIDPEQLEILKSNIPKLKNKINLRKIIIPEEKIIFLPARNKYNRQIRENFPKSKIISWANFRRSRELLV